MKTFKILQVASGDLWAGAEVQFYNLCQKLNAFEGIRLRAVVLNPGILADKLTHAGIDVAILNEQTLSSFVILRRLTSIVSAFQPDIIHSHRIKENVLAGVASLFFPETKCVTTIHGAPEIPFAFHNLHKKCYKLAEWLFIKFRFSLKIYVSHELQSRLAPASGEKTRVIENGIDIEETLEKARLRHTADCGQDAYNICFLGRLVPVKRLDILLDIAEQAVIREKLPYIFHIVGNGPLYPEFQSSVAERGLWKHVRMHGFLANPIPLLARMDCMLITSDHEGLPTNLLEAMCLGVPVIAHAVGEIPRVLNYGKLGTLIETQDAKSYIDAIKYCVSTGKGNNTAVNAPPIWVKNHYSAAENAEKHFNLYKQILDPQETKECMGF